MAALTVQSVVLNTTGLDVTPDGTIWTTANGGGDTFTAPSTGHVFLLVDTSASTTTVTIASQVSCDQGQTHNIALGMAANEIRACGPINPSRFKDSDGNVNLSYSTTTDVRVCVLKV